MWDGSNTTLGGLFENKRPDLIYDSMPRDIFEIKPQGSEALGAVQLNEYLNIPGTQSIPGSFGLIFRGDSSLTLSGGRSSEARYTYSPSSYPGVVSYRVSGDDIFQQFRGFFSQRPTGMPLPLPPRLPPVVIP